MTGPNTTASGLGWAHQQDRARLLRELVDGTPCPLPEYCGGAPMIHPNRCPDGPCFHCLLDDDHTIPRAQGGTHGPTRLTHRWCNRRRGNDTKRELRAQREREQHERTRQRRTW